MSPYEEAVRLLKPYLPDNSKHFHVTLTYAQSLDGCIGVETRDGNRPVALSGSESLVMTHYLRNTHDAIMVGIGTVLADDPSLTVRQLPAQSADGTPISIRHPHPIVLDKNLKFPSDCKLLRHPRGPPIILTGIGHDTRRRSELEAAGCRVVVVRPRSDDASRLDVKHGFEILASEFGLKSVMVEGGATVISDMLNECLKEGGDTKLVDSLIVTVAPRILGANGIRPSLTKNDSAGIAGLELPNAEWGRFGPDVVLATRL